MAQVNGNSGAASGLGPRVCGVWGDSRNNPGVVGTSKNEIGVMGISSSGRFGVGGSGDIAGVAAEGVTHGLLAIGQGCGVRGVCQTKASPHNPGVYAGVWGDGVDVGVYALGSTGLLGKSTASRGLAGWFLGNVWVQGTLWLTAGIKAAVVPHPDGTHRQLCAVESPESWFEDFGRAELRDGRAEVALDADFAALVDTDDYHVFLTPEGESAGLYVSARTPSTFEVREQAGERSTLRFSYRIVARRGDVTHERLAVVEVPRPPQPGVLELGLVEPGLFD